MDCCINDLGSFPHNEDLNTNLLASQSGVYKIVLFFAGIRIVRSVTFDYYEDIIIPRPFNETYQYRLQIIQPDGTLLTLNDCENFAFKIYININTDCNGNDCNS